MGRMIRVGVLATAVFAVITAAIHIAMAPYI